MAVDEALLETAGSRNECTLRLYRWSEATVSLGYFQSSAAFRRISKFAALPVVRRLSGGGAILHHHEITYSWCFPPTCELSRQPHLLYERIHLRIINVLAKSGISANMRGEVAPSGEQPFLCFARSDSRDIVLQNHKILGSAQRRRRGVVLQHGGLLLRRSPYAPEFSGLLDLATIVLTEPEFIEALAVGMSQLLMDGQARRTGLS